MKALRYGSWIGKYSMVLIFALCIIWGMGTSPIEIFSVSMKQIPYDGNWTQLVDGKEIKITTAEDVVKMPVGEARVMETTLPQIAEDMVFVFVSKNQEVRMYLDDEMCYEFVMEDGFRHLKTPGNEWNELFLDPSMSGARLRVELTAHVDYYNSLLRGCYLVHFSQLFGLQVEWLWLRILISSFLLVIAILSYVNGRLWYGTKTRKYVMLLGDFYLTIAFWGFANAGSFDILFRRPVVSYLMEMLSIRVLPIMAYLFVRQMLSRRYLVLEILGAVLYAQFVVTCVLQFVFGVSFLETLWLTHVILVVGSLLDFAMIFWHLYMTRAHKEQRNYLFVCTGVFFASAILEVWRFYILPEHESLISCYIAAGYVAYTCIAHVILVHRSARLDRGQTKLENKNVQLQNKVLIRQINAHFFFNVLNVISALCKQNPAKADRAVTLLSKYMRQYMYFVNTSKTIPFASELELIRVYLSLEAMRFEGEFEVDYQLEAMDFVLPPLSIQPLVENAIVHGIRRTEHFGRVVLRTQRKGQNVLVTVQDNGAGFDVKELAEKESIALDNLRTRMANMVDGTVQIISERGVGTTVTVTIPTVQEKHLAKVYHPYNAEKAGEC